MKKFFALCAFVAFGYTASAQSTSTTVVDPVAPEAAAKVRSCAGHDHGHSDAHATEVNATDAAKPAGCCASKAAAASGCHGAKASTEAGAATASTTGEVPACCAGKAKSAAGCQGAKAEAATTTTPVEDKK